MKKLTNKVRKQGKNPKFFAADRWVGFKEILRQNLGNKC